MREERGGRGSSQGFRQIAQRTDGRKYPKESRRRYKSREDHWFRMKSAYYKIKSVDYSIEKS